MSCKSHRLILDRLKELEVAIASQMMLCEACAHERIKPVAQKAEEPVTKGPKNKYSPAQLRQYQHTKAIAGRLTPGKISTMRVYRRLFYGFDGAMAVLNVKARNTGYRYSYRVQNRYEKGPYIIHVRMLPR